VNTAVTGASVLDPGRKWWTRTPEKVAERIMLVEQRAAEQVDMAVVHAVADAMTAERTEVYPHFAAVLDAASRLKRPPKWADGVPGWARTRYEQERGAV
jgi:hypothetical protein